jgi:hypothetical protein
MLDSGQSFDKVDTSAQVSAPHMYRDWVSAIIYHLYRSFTSEIAIDYFVASTKFAD